MADTINLKTESPKEKTTMQSKTIKEIMQETCQDFEDLEIQETEDTLGSLHDTLAKRKKELEDNLTDMHLRIITLQEMCVRTSKEIVAVQDLLNFYN